MHTAWREDNGRDLLEWSRCRSQVFFTADCIPFIRDDVCRTALKEKHFHNNIPKQGDCDTFFLSSNLFYHWRVMVVMRMVVIVWLTRLSTTDNSFVTIILIIRWFTRNSSCRSHLLLKKFNQFILRIFRIKFEFIITIIKVQMRQFSDILYIN